MLQGVHDEKEWKAIFTGVAGAVGGAGANGPQRERTGARVRTVGADDPQLVAPPPAKTDTASASSTVPVAVPVTDGKTSTSPPPN